jgi:hypothetical protein
MNPQALIQLAIQTVRAPREVAQILISARLGREALLTAFALVVALNTLVFTVMAMTVSPGETSGVINLSPLAFMVLLAGSVALAIFTITFGGRPLGGTARIEEIALMLIWLQGLRFVMQVALIVLGFILPAAGLVLVLAVAILGLWILLNFIDVAHGFGNLGKAAFVLIISLLGAVVGLSILLSFAGASSLGLSDYV